MHETETQINITESATCFFPELDMYCWHEISRLSVMYFIGSIHLLSFVTKVRTYQPIRLTRAVLPDQCSEMKIMWKTLRVLQLCVSRILLSADTASRILNERSTGDPVINHCCQPNKTRSNLAFSLRIHPLAAETLVSFCLFTQNLQSSAIFCCIFFSQA